MFLPYFFHFEEYILPFINNMNKSLEPLFFVVGSNSFIIYHFLILIFIFARLNYFTIIVRRVLDLIRVILQFCGCKT
jgi:hypothetical protein